MKQTETAIRDLKNAALQKEPERVYEALCSLLQVAAAEDLLRAAPLLAEVIPELAPMIGFDQRSPHHAYDVFTHTAYVTAAVPGDPVLRWAALLHDVGKVPTFTQDETGRGHFYGHARKSAEMADDILLRLHAPDELREQVVFLIGKHMTKLEPDPMQLRSCLSRLGWDAVERLLTLQEADMVSKGIGKPRELAQFAQIREILNKLDQK